jgi:hypothetical protein
VGETERESGDRIKVHHQPEKVEEEEEENKTEFQFVAFSVVRFGVSYYSVFSVRRAHTSQH